MIKVVIRHATWDIDDAVEVGEFAPSDVKHVVNLIKEYGVAPFEGLEDDEPHIYSESQFDLDRQRFEIIVE